MINEKLNEKLKELMVKFEGRVFNYGVVKIEVKNMKCWDEGNEDIEFMCELNGYLVRDGILRESNLDMLESQIEEIISINSFVMGLRS